MDKIDELRTGRLCDGFTSAGDTPAHSCHFASMPKLTAAWQSQARAQRTMALLESGIVHLRKRATCLTPRTPPARRYSCYYALQSKMPCHSACAYGEERFTVRARHGSRVFSVSSAGRGESAAEIRGAARVRRPLGTMLCLAGFAVTLLGTLCVGSLMGWIPVSERGALEQTRDGAEVTKPAAAKPMRPRRTLRVNVQPRLPEFVVPRWC